MKIKKKCYQCKFKGEVPGSTHICCLFDWRGSKHEKPTGNELGIRRGWFHFPFNYDPVWMIGQCKQFKAK